MNVSRALLPSLSPHHANSVQNVRFGSDQTSGVTAITPPTMPVSIKPPLEPLKRLKNGIANIFTLATPAELPKVLKRLMFYTVVATIFSAIATGPAAPLTVLVGAPMHMAWGVMWEITSAFIFGLIKNPAPKLSP